jgi:glutamyl-tRNA(Gln) amidotransferase subunit E
MLTLPDGGDPWEHPGWVVDARSTLAFCDFAPIRQALDRGEMVCGVRLPGFEGLLTHRTQPGLTFAREFADRIRVIACPVHRPFMIHSDLRDYGLDPHQWRTLRKQLKAEEGDAMVVVWAGERDASTAVKEVFLRAQDALAGVPAETRQAFRDGTNGFERILPGPDRMYPDTDTPPLPIADTVVEEIRLRLPEAPWDREARYVAMGLSAEEARKVARAPWADLFDDLAPSGPSVARQVARGLAKRLPYHRRSGLGEPPPSEALASVVRAIENEAIRPEAFERILDHLAESPSANVDEILKPYRIQNNELDQLNIAVEGIVAEATAALPGRSLDTATRWGMGRIMRQFLGRVDPRGAEELLRTTLEAQGWEEAS